MRTWPATAKADRAREAYDVLVTASLRIEETTGADSIPTIRRIYHRTDYTHEAGAVYLCPFPGCTFRRGDPVAMWLHVHTSPKHNQSRHWPELAEVRRQVRAAYDQARENGLVIR